MSTVEFPTKLSRAFYRRAKKLFPNEEFAVLLGTHTSKTTSIKALYYPPQRLECLSPNQVPVTTEWYEDAERVARELGLQVLGDIHTHCYDLKDYGTLDCVPEPIPSGSDWESSHVMKLWWPRKYRIMGIVRVVKKEGRYRCQTKFFPAISLPTTVK